MTSQMSRLSLYSYNKFFFFKSHNHLIHESQSMYLVSSTTNLSNSNVPNYSMRHQYPEFPNERHRRDAHVSSTYACTASLK